MRHLGRIAAQGLALLATGGVAAAAATSAPPLSRPAVVAVQARSCKQVGSCEEAVQIWCDGYRRADGDGDGIPCENVCRTKAQVDEIRQRIGC